jgi:hypothetical protein
VAQREAPCGGLSVVVQTPGRLPSLVSIFRSVATARFHLRSHHFHQSSALLRLKTFAALSPLLKSHRVLTYCRAACATSGIRRQRQ